MFGENSLDVLLNLIADRIDLDRCAAVDNLYRRTFAYEDIDWPPLIIRAPFAASIELPEPWSRFRRYPYKETFDNPEAMLQNVLLERIVPGLIAGDESPLAVLNNHGVVQVSTLLGADWNWHEEDYPWVKPLTSVEQIEEIVFSGKANTEQNVLFSNTLDTLKFYKDILSKFPPCDRAIQISMPDLQGPMNNAEQLWGSGIYYAFAEEPDLLERLLTRIVNTMLEAIEAFRPHTYDRLEPEATTQERYVIPGRLLLRNDSSNLLSPGLYREFIREHDARLLREVGGGTIHFCGNGQHLIPEQLEIPDLQGLDFGQSEMMDVPAAYSACRDKKIPITNLNPGREALVSGEAKRSFPTGVVFVYKTESIEDAVDVVRAYKAC